MIVEADGVLEEGTYKGRVNMGNDSGINYTVQPPSTGGKHVSRKHSYCNLIGRASISVTGAKVPHT